MGIAKQEREMAAQGNGCLGKAADDEPVFILRAKDKFAPTVVEFWASKVEEATIRFGASDSNNWPPQKVKEARACAHMMRAWQELNESKVTQRE